MTDRFVPMMIIVGGNMIEKNIKERIILKFIGCRSGRYMTIAFLKISGMEANERID
ncbi:hypothetical protein [Mucilaginibacter sp. UYCu711]|uniref:hypothetical protein n=1 Tax=Mucilaginibacter sp. UYCu711 TaxID=3156339 RepID=UPI003D1E9677